MSVIVLLLLLVVDGDEKVTTAITAVQQARTCAQAAVSTNGEKQRGGQPHYARVHGWGVNDDASPPTARMSHATLRMN